MHLICQGGLIDVSDIASPSSCPGERAVRYNRINWLVLRFCSLIGEKKRGGGGGGHGAMNSTKRIDFRILIV